MIFLVRTIYNQAENRSKPLSGLVANKISFLAILALHNVTCLRWLVPWPPSTQQCHFSRFYHLINILPNNNLVALQETQTGVHADQSAQSVVHAMLHRVDELFRAHDFTSGSVLLSGTNSVYSNTIAKSCTKSVGAM